MEESEAPKRKRPRTTELREIQDANRRRISITEARGRRFKNKKRQATTNDNRDRLSRAISSYAIADIEAVIKAGPFQLTLVEVEGRDGKKQRVLPMFEERSKLWQFAVTFAADRGRLPKQQTVQIEGDVTLAPIEVRFTNFPRPSDT